MTDDVRISPSTYSRTAVVLHWVIGLLVLSTIPLGLYGASSESTAAQTATNTHKTIGIAILLLTLVRIGWRLAHKPPALAQSMPAWQRRAARISHALFYVLLLILPLSGWWMSSAVPKRHPFGIGGWEIPFLPVPRGWASAGPAYLVHVSLGFLMIGLVLLHIFAVIKHHYVDRDDTLARMLPRKL